MVSEPGAKFENFIASHLLKAVHWWQDNGFGDYGLYYLRIKDKREVDFLVTRDAHPWFLVEAKSSGNADINKNLKYFQTVTKATHAFQISKDEDFINANSFNTMYPVKVPARTFLSQLI